MPRKYVTSGDLEQDVQDIWSAALKSKANSKWKMASFKLMDLFLDLNNSDFIDCARCINFLIITSLYLHDDHTKIANNSPAFLYPESDSVSVC